ncbi:STAS/SEC14 domain-containing protein [Pseudarthrobacter sp. NamE5]|uniref:DUF7793 family protein n=1 Tax=Pseudarthrobacter sp. NamE5 TaxID=2576839 RepID=UPI00110B5AE6|nr:STAS/SEC14 domain-containing protein [Pseudarthrobacter sp. NamE5]TLM84724.1 STAS/SEC14 domain-containing protein [Pseudarthrobacter sp. NamE5]
MDSFTASCHDGLLRLQWGPGVFITYEMAVRAARALEGLSGGRTLPILVDITGVTGLSPEARAGMNAYRGFSHTALVGDHPMGTVLAAFAQQSPTPSAYFTTEPDALRWLSEQSGRPFLSDRPALG